MVALLHYVWRHVAQTHPVQSGYGSASGSGSNDARRTCQNGGCPRPAVARTGWVTCGYCDSLAA
jgi:hypothetical protein